MRGDVTDSTKSQPEQRLFGYLGKVADAASGKLSPAARIRFVESLRSNIEQERARRGADLATLDRILASLGDPVTLVDAEVQRDPDYQASLTARLSKAPSGGGPQVPLIDDLAELIAPASSAPLYAPPRGSYAGGGLAGAGDGPELCLDPDPFTPEHSVETVGALHSAAAASTMTMVLPDFSLSDDDGSGEPASPVVARVRSVWERGPKIHPQEALAIALFLVGAALGQWVVLLVAGLVACTSRFYSEVEKWALAVGVPVATGLIYTFGFWLDKRGYGGGPHVSASALLDGAATFFGTLPRIAALLAALYLSWRLARGVTR